jgi:hypothetical protein
MFVLLGITTDRASKIPDIIVLLEELFQLSRQYRHEPAINE